MRTSDTINDLVGALIKARTHFKPVLRDATGQVGQNRSYKYAPLETVIDATGAALAGAGLVLIQAVDAETSTLVSRLAHTSGQWIESAFPLRGYERPQEFGSQLTYARRYSMLALLSLAQEDDDGAAAQTAAPAPRPSVPVAAAPSRPAPSNGSHEEQTLQDYVAEVTVSHGKTQKGRDWTRYRVKFAQSDLVAGTFDSGLGESARMAQEAGILVQAVLKDTEKGTNLLALHEVTNEDQPPQQPDGPPF